MKIKNRVEHIQRRPTGRLVQTYKQVLVKKNLLICALMYLQQQRFTRGKFWLAPLVFF